MLSRANSEKVGVRVFQVLCVIAHGCGIVMVSQGVSFAWPRSLADEKTRDYVAQHAFLLVVGGVGLMALTAAVTTVAASLDRSKGKADVEDQ